MKKIKLEKYDDHLKEKLKDKEFKKAFELERAKVSLAQKIAELREKSNFKQVDLAKKMHVSQQFISQIETGQEINLTLDTLLNIARCLNRSIKISFVKNSGQMSCLKVT